MPKNFSRRAILAGTAIAPLLRPDQWPNSSIAVSFSRPAEDQSLERLEGLTDGAELSIPRGYSEFRTPFRFSGQRLNLRGAGPNVSFIRFTPAAPAAAIELNTPGVGGQYQSSVIGLGFLSDNAVDKTAIRLVNVSSVNIERIAIASGLWPGDGSIGVQTLGREMIRIRDCDIACARPIVVSPNRQHPTLAADYLQISSSILISTSNNRSCIEVEDGTVLTNVSVRDCALVGGASGFRFDDRTSAGASFHIEFQNVRTEQGTDRNGWSFDIRSTAQQIQNILFQNVRCDRFRNGIRIRNGLQITLINVLIEQQDGKRALDIEFMPGTVLTILGGYIQSGAFVTLSNARKVFGTDPASGSMIGPVEIWVYDPS